MMVEHEEILYFSFASILPDNATLALHPIKKTLAYLIDDDGRPRKDGRKRPDSIPAEIGREAMGIGWMNKRELAQAIPPAYTRWIGEHLLDYIGVLRVIQVIERLEEPLA